MNKIAVRAKETNDQAVKLNVVTNNVSIKFEIEKIFRQGLDIDGSIEPNQMKSRVFGWDDVAKKDSLVVLGVNIANASDHPQVVMNGV